MKWINTEQYSEFHLKGSVLTLGNFDGLHLGHQQLVKSLLISAKKHNLPSVVLTFYPHPQEVLLPGKPQQYLFSRKDLFDQLRHFGVDYLIEIPFNKDLANLTAETFYEQHLYNKFKPQKIIVGYDFCFGRDRNGNIDLLRALTLRYQSKLDVLPAYQWKGAVVSSSRIRKSLAEGKIKDVQSMLGRKYYKEGEVVSGQSQGRELGFPTANITPSGAPMAEGVYCTYTKIDKKTFKSITNVGRRPTFDENNYQVIETYIFDINLDLYGMNLQILFDKYLRPEIKFKDMASLKAQIIKDIETCKNNGP